MKRQLICNLSVGQRVVGTVNNCLLCDALFVGRRDAQFCSKRCQYVYYDGKNRKLNKMRDKWATTATFDSR